jgi:hypothetical protein
MVVSKFLLHYMLSLMFANKPNMCDLYQLYLVTYTAVAYLVEALRYKPEGLSLITDGVT